MAEDDPEKLTKELIAELRDVKRLLILQLLRGGASQAVIAKALGVSQPSISRMFPGGIGKIRPADVSD